MKRGVLFITLFSLYIISCTENQESTSPTSKVERIEKSSECGLLETDRLRINEEVSIVVRQCFENSVLTNIDYEIVASLPEDQYAVLSLIDDQQDNSLIRVDIFNNNLVLGENYSQFYNSYRDVGGESESYMCECTNEMTTYCEMFRYKNLTFCNGYCGCSVVLWFSTSHGLIEGNGSSIILPNNF